MQQYQRVHALPAHRGTASIGSLYSVMSEGQARIVKAVQDGRHKKAQSFAMAGPLTLFSWQSIGRETSV